MVLASKSGGKIDPAKNYECAVHVLQSLQDAGFKVLQGAGRT